MRMIFLHGPGAVGKLTVARELASQTGLRVFHNHLVVDAALALFDFGTEPFVRLRESMWLSAFDEAARAAVSFIFTFAPEATVPPDFVERVVQTVESHGGEVVFVKLTCRLEDQEARVTAASRKEFGKLRSLELLRELRAKGADTYPPLPDSGLTIDTSRFSPEDAASQIRGFLGLTAGTSRPDR